MGKLKVKQTHISYILQRLIAGMWRGFEDDGDEETILKMLKSRREALPDSQYRVIKKTTIIEILED